MAAITGPIPGAEPGRAGGDAVVRGRDRGDGPLHGGQLPGQHGQMTIDRGPNEGIGGGGTPVVLADAVLDEVLAATDPIGQLSFTSGRQRGWGWLGLGAVARDHLRIDRIGFRPPALAAGEIAHMRRIDHGRRDVVRVQGQHQVAVVGAGRFQDDHGLVGAADLRNQPVPAGRGIGKPLTARGRCAGHVEMRLGDINAKPGTRGGPQASSSHETGPDRAMLERRRTSCLSMRASAELPR